MIARGVVRNFATSTVVLLSAAVAIAGCRPRLGQLPAETPSVQVAPVLAPDACAVPPPTAETLLGMPARPARLLAGGAVKAGDFAFDMWLYCDPALSPSGQGPAYSEVAGLGIYLAWRYSGPEIQGPTQYTYGLGDLAIAGGGDGGPLTSGSGGSYVGGIHSKGGALAAVIQSGNLVKITTSVRSGQLVQSAEFSFAFQKGLAGLKLGSYAVEPSP